jgi:hypothetical protein
MLSVMDQTTARVSLLRAAMRVEAERTLFGPIGFRDDFLRFPIVSNGWKFLA